MAVFRYLYAPLYFLGVVGGATAVVSSGSSPAWLFILIIAAIGTSLAVERIAPFENQWNSSHGDGRRDTLHALVNEGSLVAMVLLLPLIVSLVPWGSAWPTTLPLSQSNVDSPPNCRWLRAAPRSSCFSPYYQHRKDTTQRCHAETKE